MTDTTRGSSTSTRRYEDYRDTYRSDWERRYGQNKPWQEHERGYRYGWEAGQNDQYRNREFQDTESDLQSGWSDYSSRYDRDSGDQPGGSTGKDSPGEHQTHSMGAHDSVGGKINHAWENFKDTVREGFDRARSDR